MIWLCKGFELGWLSLEPILQFTVKHFLATWPPCNRLVEVGLTRHSFHPTLGCSIFACHSLAIAMTGQDLQKLLPGETLDFHVWSSPKNIPAYDYDFWSSKDYDGYRQRNMTVHLDKKIDNNKDMLKAWAHMARADILIMSQSSFSMVPAATWLGGLGPSLGDLVTRVSCAPARVVPQTQCLFQLKRYS